MRAPRLTTPFAEPKLNCKPYCILREEARARLFTASYELKCIASATLVERPLSWCRSCSLLSGAAAFAPAARRWARSAPRALRGVARAAGDDGLSLRAERLKSLLLDEDFDGAAREGAAALEVRLDDGTLIYAPLDVDGCVRLRPSERPRRGRRRRRGWRQRRHAVALTRAFGLDPARVRLVDRGDAVGASFRAWPAEMRFISPSTRRAPSTRATSRRSSPRRRSTCAWDRRGGADRADDGDSTRRAAGGIDETIRARFVVWAAGEFQYPREGPVPGSEHCVHNSRVASWATLEGDERVVIGGYESGVDAAVNLARAGKRATVLASTATWNVQTPDPSTELAPTRRLATPPGLLSQAQAPRRSACCASRRRPGRLRRRRRVARGRGAAGGGVAPDGRRGVGAAGAPGDELVVHTAHPPVLATGFEGSVAAAARDLFDLADEDGGGCLAGAPLLSAEDESTKVPGVFLVGPSVVQGDLSFCFVYKFRQRFGIVADAICRGLGRETKTAVAGLRQANMYTADLSCCENVRRQVLIRGEAAPGRAARSDRGRLRSAGGRSAARGGPAAAAASDVAWNARKHASPTQATPPAQAGAGPLAAAARPAAAPPGEREHLRGARAFRRPSARASSTTGGPGPGGDVRRDREKRRATFGRDVANGRFRSATAAPKQARPKTLP
ncbi:pyridine nucleotide-disulfide oxidoreductase [Aureococcus anophagefferens]|nr:pyridine nucleotide-disulfide oxidoreductase [Aureococcus anophagefferens]